MVALQNLFEEATIGRNHMNYPAARLGSVTHRDYKIRIKFSDTPGCIILTYDGTLKQKVYARNNNVETIVDFLIHKNAKDFLEGEIDLEDVEVTTKEGITKDELNDAIHLLTCYAANSTRSRDWRGINIEQ